MIPLYLSVIMLMIFPLKLKLDPEALVIWLRKNKLFLNIDKTTIMLVGTGAKLNQVQCDNFSIKIEDCQVENVWEFWLTMS